MQATSRRQEAPDSGDTFIGRIYTDGTHRMHEMLMTDAFIFLPKDEACRVYFILQLDDERI